jgi:hypothetical protein
LRRIEVNQSSRMSAILGWRRAISTIGVSALVVGMTVSVGTAGAADDVTTFNPFEVNNGFTIVGRGDVTLGNGELEGSVAAFGSLSSTHQNFPVIHQAAGMSDYTVPTVDDTPVRILAGSFSGEGNFAITNRDDSHSLEDNSPEATAVAKLVSVDGLTAVERSSFMRIHREDAGDGEKGNIDLATAPYGSGDLAPYKTTKDSVASYFEGMGGQGRAG